MERHVAFLLLSSTVFICTNLTIGRQLTNIEVLQRTTCEEVYRKAQGKRADIDFSSPIHNLSCDPGQKGLRRYHCMLNEDDVQIQFCAEWIWVEPGLCPKLYSLQGIINPEDCTMLSGCPKDRYQSHDYYEYPACFNFSKAFQTTTEKIKNNQISSGQKDGDQTTQIVSVSLGIAIPVIFICAGIVLGLICYYRKKREAEDQKSGGKEIFTGGKEIFTVDFERTRPILAAKQHLEARRSILLTGKNGEGVTTIIDAIHKKYFKEYEIRRQEYGFREITGTSKLFFVINERTLNEFFEKKDWEGLQVAMTDGQSQTKVIMDVSLSWYNDNRERLKECPGDVMHMNLSSEQWEFNESEREELIRKMMHEKGLKYNLLSDAQMRKFVEYESHVYGFYYMCGKFFYGEKDEVMKNLDDVERALNQIDGKTTGIVHEETEKQPLV